MRAEIKQEYINFLNDTKKKNNVKTWNEFKSDYVLWYVELFGIDDERTQDIMKELNEVNIEEVLKITTFKYYQLDKEFEEIEKLRKNIDMNKLKELNEINKNDAFYGWAFQNGNVLYETLESLKSEYYHEKYIHDIGLTYIEILKACQKDK